MATYLIVPDEFADELVEQGVAVPSPRARGTVIDLVVVGATSAATCVTLLQGPETVMRFATALRSLAKKKGTGLELRIKGRRGEIHLLDCTEETPLEELATLLKGGLLD